jgi:hypothetical protein
MPVFLSEYIGCLRAPKKRAAVNSVMNVIQNSLEPLFQSLRAEIDGLCLLPIAKECQGQPKLLQQ